MQHDGVDTDYFAPRPGHRLKLPDLDLSHVEEIVTYVARGMEPYRGFPQAMAAFAEVQKRSPRAKCQAPTLSSPARTAWPTGGGLPDGDTFRQKMLRELDFDRDRLHFTGRLPRSLYREVLLASSVHVYLTVPFVLSWSTIEAMSAGCLLVASNTDPVREVVRDGENGLLADFFDTGASCRAHLRRAEPPRRIHPPSRGRPPHGGGAIRRRKADSATRPPAGGSGGRPDGRLIKTSQFRRSHLTVQGR